MSYVRFADDSDVYAYYNGKEYVCHVARMKQNPERMEAYLAKCGDRYSDLQQFAACYDPLDHPLANEVFTVATGQELLDLLTSLKEQGLDVPEHPFKRLREELCL